MPAKCEIEINEVRCLGCGYCAHFCNRGCIEMTDNKFNSQGYPLPAFVNQEKCTGCAICSWMCPQFAIDIYRQVGEAPEAGRTNRAD